MDINELESYRLSDAVKFNDKLNPRLWSNEHLKPEVKQTLLAIADDFREFLGIKDLDVQDITVSGSNAAYTYTPHSDIDLHLVVDLSKVCSNEVYKELFNAKKYQYNDEHNYRIGPYDVELYVQDSNEPHHSQGIYSLVNDDWIRVPTRRHPTVDDISVKSKYEDLGNRIEQALKSGNVDSIRGLWDKIKNMRQTGLDKTGEFGPENLAFKLLRRHGLLTQLKAAVNHARDQELSLQETRPKKKKIYGYKNYWYPGYDYYAGPEQPSEVEESAQVQIKNKTHPLEQVVEKFVKFCAKHLHLKTVPTINLMTDPKFGAEMRTMGHYMDDSRTIEVEVKGRHILDVLRTVAHELVHYSQHERGDMPEEAGETGSPWENEAHAKAGVLMRYFDRAHPEFFNARVIDNKVTDEDYDPNGPPPGPEFKPTMPAGTVKVDVSDVYDWYKLGQHVSNLKGLGQHDFGAGPPSTIMAFGSEDEEHKYIDALKKTGLTTTDIDPVDPKQPKGMPRQKTDPTYNVNEVQEQCPECGGPMFSELLINEKQDACYYKVKSRYKVWPSAYASGALVQCRKKGAANWGNKSKNEGVAEEQLDEKCWDTHKQVGMKSKGGKMVPNCVPKESQELDENLRDWFKEKWVRFGPDGKIRGDCARGDDSEGKPKCLPQSKAHSLGKKGRASAAARKRREDPNPERSGKAINVNTKKKNESMTEATGYIPVNRREAHDPRYSMAITQDIKPGEVQRQAAKMGFKTDAAGVPPLLMKLQNQLQEIKTGESR